MRAMTQRYKQRNAARERRGGDQWHETLQGFKKNKERGKTVLLEIFKGVVGVEWRVV